MQKQNSNQERNQFNNEIKNQMSKQMKNKFKNEIGYIELNEKGIIITGTECKGNYFDEYFISRESFGNIIGNNISDCIFEAMYLPWADKSGLYSLGEMISKETEASNIDWVATFAMVEKMDLLMTEVHIGRDLLDGLDTAEICREVEKKLKASGFNLGVS